MSLAINYAIGGESPAGYHLFNLGLHAAAALTLFGLVRRTLLLPAMRTRHGAHATLLAFLAALGWMVHPVQSESVSCVIQRTELLVGLFALLTFYAFVRSVDGSAAGKWRGCAVVACALGMTAKEVMVGVPLLVLLFDRGFVAGTLREAWRLRRGFHLGLAATWLLLAALVFGMGGSRGDAAGFGLGVTWWSYALKQCEAIVAYLALTIWPHPLVLDYGTDVVTDPLRVLPQMLLLVGLVGATLAALRWRPRAGFLAFAFFAILAPSSSVVPLITQTMAEHRLYLPLACVLLLAVVGAHAAVGPRAVPAFAAIAVACLLLTIARNRLMQDELGIWADTIAKRPGNARALGAYALALSDRGRAAEAVPLFERALALDPKSAVTAQNLGYALFQLRDYAAAATHFRRALELDPKFAAAHNNLGLARAELGDAAGAIESYRAALALDPDHAGAHQNLARLLFALNRFEEAARHYEAVVARRPRSADAHYNLGLALARSGAIERAQRSFDEALRLNPSPAAYLNYARFLVSVGRNKDAIERLESALRLRPDHAEARAELETLRRQP